MFSKETEESGPRERENKTEQKMSQDVSEETASGFIQNQHLHLL